MWSMQQWLEPSLTWKLIQIGANLSQHLSQWQVFPVSVEIIMEKLMVSRRQSKTSILSTSEDKKSLETEFLIAFCRQTGDKWQSKTLFLGILIGVRQLLRAFMIAAYPVWCWVFFFKSLLSSADFFFKIDIFFFDLILYVPSTIFQLNRDWSSWVEPVLS